MNVFCSMVEHVLAHPGEITVITLGPLANLAAAITIGGERFVKAIRRVVMMGGSIDGEGNKTAAAEANVHNDPEAARLVFSSLPDITMAGLNVTKHIPLSDEFRQRVRATGDVGQFLYDISTHYVALLTSWRSAPVVHDGSAVMACVRPDLFDSQMANVDVETAGSITTGVTVVDWRGRWKRKPNVRVLTKVDTAKFYDVFVERVKKFSYFKAHKHDVDARATVV